MSSNQHGLQTDAEILRLRDEHRNESTSAELAVDGARNAPMSCVGSRREAFARTQWMSQRTLSLRKIVDEAVTPLAQGVAIAGPIRNCSLRNVTSVESTRSLQRSQSQRSIMSRAVSKRDIKDDVSCAGSGSSLTESTRTKTMCMLYALVACSSITAGVLSPNYPIMAFPGVDPESFESTSPLGFNAATYFIPMMSLSGEAIASMLTGPISDKVGRRRVLLVVAVSSILSTIARWYFRNNFWHFNIASFIFGLCNAGSPVALAYVGDAYKDNQVKEVMFGYVFAVYIIGFSGGGIIAILTASKGLFTCLLIAAGMMSVAVLFSWFYLLEPRELCLALDGPADTDIDGSLELAPHQDVDNLDKPKDTQNKAPGPPKELNWPVFLTVIVGALADNIGSKALFPFCLSPLAFDHFVVADDPVLVLDSHKWISVMVFLMAFPGTLISQPVYNRFGAAVGCVFGNIMTGVVMICLLYIVLAAEASGGTVGAFVATMYIGFPFTVLSQLSTSPMLDRISPHDRRGFVQGANMLSMNLGTAVAPWAFGVLADETSTATAIWTGFGVSMIAAIINAPLIFQPQMGPLARLVKKQETDVVCPDHTEGMDEDGRCSFNEDDSVHLDQTERTFLEESHQSIDENGGSSFIMRVDEECLGMQW